MPPSSHLPNHDVTAAGRQADRTRRRLIDATIALAAERGWEGFSLADVGERAGVSRGTPGAHFGKRACLVVAAAEELLGPDALSVPAECPTELVCQLLATFQGDRGRAILELQLLSERATAASDLSRMIAEFMARLTAATSASLGSLIDLSNEPGGDSAELAAGLISAVLGSAVLRVSLPVAHEQALRVLEPVDRKNTRSSRPLW